MKITYRPDIDALRGIAVLSVLFYHAKFTYLGVRLFSGGFLGVDIFFVLTGVLITTLLLNEYKKKNNIKFVNLISLLCDHENKLCNFLSKENKDELYRDYGRFSFSGLKFLGDKLHEIKLFNF